MLKRHVQTGEGLIELLVWFTGLLVSVLASILIVDLTSLRASVSFLSDALAFEAVVVSVAIPVGLEVVGRLYDKYGSNRVKTTFLARIQIVPLMLTVFVSVVLVLLLQAGLNELYPTLSMLALFGAVVTALQFWWFMSGVVDFVVNEPFAALDDMADVIELEFPG